MDVEKGPGGQAEGVDTEAMCFSCWNVCVPG